MKQQLCRIHVPIKGSLRTHTIDLSPICEEGNMPDALDGILLNGLAIEPLSAQRLVSAEVARQNDDPAWRAGLDLAEQAMIRLYSTVEIEGIKWEQAFDAYGRPLGALSTAGFLDSRGMSYRAK